MAKYFLRKKARELRKKGISVNKIADELNVSKSTVSIWVRDIILTVEQLEKLRQNSIIGREKGRLKGSLTQKHKVLQKFEVSKRQGIKAVGDLTRRELLFVGLALYWAEGAKKNRNVRFCNSDPALIDLMLKWLKDCFGIKKDRLAVKVGINIIHKHREKDVKEYWSKITNIPLKQFRTTSFKKSKLKKVYSNYNNHFGTFEVRVLKPSQLYYKIMGLIYGLSSQGSSVG